MTCPLRHLARSTAAALGAALRLPRPLSAPLELWIEPTSLCPGRCVLCPQGRKTVPGTVSAAKTVPGTVFMANEVFGRVLDALRRWRPRVNLHHRGEPLLHPRIVEMIRAASAAGASVSLHTGGHVPLPAPPEVLLTAGLRELVISLGAVSPERFAALRPGADYAAVLARTRALLAARRPGAARVVIEVFEPFELSSPFSLFTPSAPLRLRPLHNWAGEKGVGRVFPRSSRSRNMLPRRDLRRRKTLPTPFSRCLFPFYAMVVLSDGRVAACPQDFEARLVVGDLREAPLEAIWRGEALRRLRRRTLRDLARERPCSACDRIRRRGILGFPLDAATFWPRKVFSR